METNDYLDPKTYDIGFNVGIQHVKEAIDAIKAGRIKKGEIIEPTHDKKYEMNLSYKVGFIDAINGVRKIIKTGTSN